MTAATTADALIENLLPLVDEAPGADPAKIASVLGGLDLPPAAAYRALLERTNGLDLPGATLYGVDDEGEIDAITEPLDYYRPLIALIGSASHGYGWHTAERVWCRFDPIGSVIEETYPSDLALLHEALAHYVPGYAAAAARTASGSRSASGSAQVLPSGRLPERLAELDEDESPQADAPYDTAEAAEAFQEAAGAQLPADYLEFLTQRDGIEVDDLTVYGASDMAIQQKDAPEEVLLLGTLAEEVLIYDARGECWSIVDEDLDLDDDEDAFDTFAELLGEALDRVLD